MTAGNEPEADKWEAIQIALLSPVESYLPCPEDVLEDLEDSQTADIHGREGEELFRTNSIFAPIPIEARPLTRLLYGQAFSSSNTPTTFVIEGYLSVALSDDCIVVHLRDDDEIGLVKQPTLVVRIGHHRWERPCEVLTSSTNDVLLNLGTHSELLTWMTEARTWLTAHVGERVEFGIRLLVDGG